jgi:hypothetical protein
MQCMCIPDFQFTCYRTDRETLEHVGDDFSSHAWIDRTGRQDDHEHCVGAESLSPFLQPLYSLKNNGDTSFFGRQLPHAAWLFFLSVLLVLKLKHYWLHDLYRPAMSHPPSPTNSTTCALTYTHHAGHYHYLTRHELTNNSTHKLTNWLLLPRTTRVTHGQATHPHAANELNKMTTDSLGWHWTMQTVVLLRPRAMPLHTAVLHRTAPRHLAKHPVSHSGNSASCHWCARLELQRPTNPSI